MLKRGNEENIQVFMGGAPDAGSLQQMASQFGGPEEERGDYQQTEGSCNLCRGLNLLMGLRDNLHQGEPLFLMA